MIHSTFIINLLIYNLEGLDFMEKILRNNCPSYLHRTINQLQNANRQLEQKIKVKVNILNNQLTIEQVNKQLIELIKHSQQQMHKECSSRLMKDQISIQQQRQMKEIIINYQKRVADLRTVLVNKQGQIVYQTYQANKQVVPSLQNMRLINKQSLQRRSIKKALQELKKIKAETQALQYCLLNKIDKQKKVKEVTNDFSASCAAQIIRNKLQNTHKDKLLIKAYNLLQVQLQQERCLKSQLQLLKIELKQSSKVCQENIHKYTNQHTKSSTKQSQINFLAELDKAEQSQKITPKLFNKIDLNIQANRPKGTKKRDSKPSNIKINKQN